MKTYRITMHLDNEFEVDKAFITEILLASGLNRREAELLWFLRKLANDPDSVLEHLVWGEDAEKVE